MLNVLNWLIFLGILVRCPWSAVFSKYPVYVPSADNIFASKSQCCHLGYKRSSNEENKERAGGGEKRTGGIAEKEEKSGSFIVFR